MSVNRVLQFLSPHRCQHCTAQQHLDRLQAECERIELLAGDTFEFWTPSLGTFLEGNREIRLLLSLEADDAAIGDDLQTYAAMQLRAMARELTAAADRLEGGAV